jgi:DNA-binding CsgD family transcriptional regulator
MRDREALLERESEIAALSGTLARARDGAGGVVLVEGPAGIGKSRLLAAAREEAERAGMEVLRARGRELEREASFGVALELLGTRLPEALLDPAGRVEPPALIRSLHSLTVSLAAERPLSIVLDDAQWADRPSLIFLAHVAARSEELPVALIVAVRSGEPGTPTDVLAALHESPAVTLLEPAGLSDAAVASIVAEELPGPEPEFAAACAHMIAGNPFMARELARALKADGIEPVSASASRVEELVPASVLRSVLTRLGRLGDAALRVATAVAVLGDGARLRHVAALAAIDAGEAERAADALAQAAILTPGEPLRFSHPLIAGAVHSDMAAFARARAHRDAAELLAADGAPVHEVAPHLLLSTPDGSPAVVATLRAAATRALSHGDPQSAATLLARALAEPPEAAERSGLLLALAQAEGLSGQVGAEEHVREAVRLAGSDPAARAQALRARSQVHVALGRQEAAAQDLHELLEAMEPGDPQAEEVLAEYLSAHRFRTSLLPEAQARVAPFIDAARRGVPPANPGLAAHVALELAFAGERPELIRTLAERAASDEKAVDPGSHGLLMGLLVQALCVVDELDAAERIADAALAAAQNQGSFMGAAAGAFHRAIPRYHRGALAQSLTDLDQAQAPHREGWTAGAPWPQSLQVHVQLALGDLGGARDTAALTFGANPPSPEALDNGIALFARARLELAEREPRSALADATAAGRHLADGFGIDHPGLIPWRSVASRAALALGERERAGELAEEALRRARWSGVPRALGTALRTAAAATKNGTRLELLHEAVEVLEASPSRLERAYARADLGAALLRAGRKHDAQAHLRAALQLADQMGAAALAESVRADLRASGARPRRAAVTGVAALTPAELRVARLAASGLTNPQIADELFVTGKTVQTHLAHAFRKLDISSRRELPNVLGEAPRS